MYQELLNIDLTSKGVPIIWGISIFIFFGFIIIFTVRIATSIKAAAQNNGRINQYLAAVPEDRVATVDAIYRNSKKDLGIALILTVIGGSFGFQNIYLGKRKNAILMFLFFWTCIPTIISLFQLSILPRIVSEFNLSIIQSLYNQIAAPSIEQ